jgi:tRNA-Thr(GGU) m(6)t(6)A37 methyltransferase TsaA
MVRVRPEFWKRGHADHRIPCSLRVMDRGHLEAIPADPAARLQVVTMGYLKYAFEHSKTMSDSTPVSISFSPIAFVSSPYVRRIDAPHQSTVIEGTESGALAEAAIEFVDGFPAAAFRDLQGFERIWLVFVFHRSEGWKAEVRPPRGGGKRSVLATRSPHRPNAIGLSTVEVVAVGTQSLRVRGMDLLDGTPILDIKPYVPYADAFPSSRAGWIDAIDAVQGQHSAPGPKRPRNKVEKPQE